MKPAEFIVIVLFPLAALFSCRDGGNQGGPDGGCDIPGCELNLPPGDGTFTFSPIEVSKITELEPLGEVQGGGGHTLPTDHVYFYWNGPTPQVPLISPIPTYTVFAPGSGAVVWIYTFPGQPDSKIMVRMTGTFSYLLSHLIIDSGIVEGSNVVAGQRIGQTNGLAGPNAIDFGVANEAITLTGFANPARYGWHQLHCDSPYKYFAEPLKSQLYSMINREGSDKDGRIDYDIPGRLVGNWFHESVGAGSSNDPEVWPYLLAFVPDPHAPTVPRIVPGSYLIDSYLLPLGAWKTQEGAQDFASVDVSSGKIPYQLCYLEGGTVAGLMLVQLMDSTHLKVEVFTGSNATDSTFTQNAEIYIR